MERGIKKNKRGEPKVISIAGLFKENGHAADNRQTISAMNGDGLRLR